MASYYCSCWICCESDCSWFIAFLLLEDMSCERRSFSRMSCLFCYMSLFKEILASLVLDNIKEIISVPDWSIDRLSIADMFSLIYCWLRLTPRLAVD